MSEKHERFKEVRESIGITQARLAKLLHRTTTVVARYENGTLNIPKHAIDFVCNEFGANREYLLEGKGEPFPFSRNGQKLLGDFYAFDTDVQEDIMALVRVAKKRYLNKKKDVAVPLPVADDEEEEEKEE